MLEIINLSYAKSMLIGWVESGQYFKDIEEALIPAYTAVDKHDILQKAAICLDVDETALSNFNFMVEKDFGWTDANLKESWVKTTTPSLRPVFDLVKTAINKGIQPFFITAREQKYYSPTLACLKNSGYPSADNLYCKPNDSSLTTAEWKFSIRTKIESQGFFMVANIGDKPTDLEGGNYLQIQIPNKFY